MMHPLKMPYSVDIFTTNLGQCNQSNSHNLSEDRHISSYILSYCATTSLHSYNVLSQLLGLFIGNTPAVAITDFSLAKELFNRQLLQFNILDLVSLLHQYLIWFQQTFRLSTKIITFTITIAPNITTITISMIIIIGHYLIVIVQRGVVRKTQ